MRTPVLTSVFAILLFAVGLPTSAQPAAPTGVIDGVVTDTNLVAIGEATASILGSNVRVVTGANGRFRIIGVLAGQHVLVIQRTGFAQAKTPVDVVANDTLRVSFTLEAGGAGVDSTGASPLIAARLQAFEERRKTARGQFKTQADIERQKPSRTADILRSFPSVRVVGSVAGRASQNIVEDICPLRLWVDGVPLRTNSVHDLPVPKQVAALETYVSAASVPLQFQTSGSEFCGAVLVWTKSGS